jgi:hypothetical protein
VRPVKIVLLEKSHNRKNFNCEEPSLNEYIQKQAGQDMRKRLATCFVAIDDNLHVLGFYTLSSESLGREMIPEQYMKQVPRSYNAPVILMGRLTRDISAKGTRLGEFLLMDALFRSQQLSLKSIGAMAVVVDPINEQAEKFYSKYDFQKLPDSGKMFLPMRIIDRLFGMI